MGTRRTPGGALCGLGVAVRRETASKLLEQFPEVDEPRNPSTRGQRDLECFQGGEQCSVESAGLPLKAGKVGEIIEKKRPKDIGSRGFETATRTDCLAKRLNRVVDAPESPVDEPKRVQNLDQQRREDQRARDREDTRVVDSLQRDLEAVEGLLRSERHHRAA